jgi:hypothetical protein
MREILVEMLQKRPFRPFRVHLRCGTVHEVREPALASVTPFTLRLSRRDISTTPPAVVDHYIISLDHVVSLELLDADEPVVVVASRTE